MNKKNAIVTGAANGIGSSIAKKLTQKNCFVILVDIDIENGNKLADELGEDNAVFMPCNISNSNEVKTLFKHIINTYKTIDILVNNAGIIRDNMIWNMPEEDFDKVIDVNLKGAWLTCKEASSIMKKQASGKIVNIASRAWLGNPGQSNYSASKAGIIGLTRVLALELGRYSITVNAIAPGFIDTPLTQKLSEEIKDKLIKTQPIRIMGQAEDIANTLLFLSDDSTKFITGQTLYVDGGKSIGAGL